MQKLAEFDMGSRFASYRAAHLMSPSARQAEIDHMIRVIDARPGETIVEIGAGHGQLTGRLLKAVSASGAVFALDNSRQSLNEIAQAFPEARRILLNDTALEFPDASADAVVTLANFHHFENKELAFKEFARVLRPGGRLVVGDVCDGTDVQRYFDGVVDRICSTGHKHRFLDRPFAHRLCTGSGLALSHWELKDVPWRFKNFVQAAKFLKFIHDAKCDDEECLRAATEYLGTRATSFGMELNWQLFFLTGRKLERRQCTRN